MSTLSFSKNDSGGSSSTRPDQSEPSSNSAAAAAADTANQPQQPARSSKDNTPTTPSNNNKTVMIVQYIFLRRDLESWPVGAVAAQAAHASVAAVVEALRATNYEPAQRYTHPHHLPHMTKCVYGVDSLTQLEDVRDQWNAQFSRTVPPTAASEATNTLYWWVEQPENIPTALATWPVERTNKVSKFIKKLNLTYF